jgi:hypothetical protein
MYKFDRVYPSKALLAPVATVLAGGKGNNYIQSAGLSVFIYISSPDPAKSDLSQIVKFYNSGIISPNFMLYYLYMSPSFAESAVYAGTLAVPVPLEALE